MTHDCDALVEKMARAAFDAANEHLEACASEDAHIGRWSDESEDGKEIWRVACSAALNIAMEEAARVADAAVSQQWQGRKIAAAIRAMIPSGSGNAS